LTRKTYDSTSRCDSWRCCDCCCWWIRRWFDIVF